MNFNLNEYRELILKEMTSFFDEKENHFKYINQWGIDVIQKLKKFALAGKMLRGSLVIFSEKMYGGEISKLSIKVALSMELFQSGFLIHDDIMDRDSMRRSEKTIFFQYKDMFEEKNKNDAYHLGESMGISVGDFAFFLGFENLSLLPEEKLKRILELFSKEMLYVCLGQMDDVYFSTTDTNLSEERILSIYLYKTSRYSFSLPLMAGAILADAETDEVRKLEIIGENLGLIFQITDDLLGLYGSEEKIGKPVGSDIKENKKTLFYYYLFKNADEKDKRYLKGIFGREKINQKELNKVLSLLKKYEVEKIVTEKVTKLAKILSSQISELKVNENYKSKLLNFLEYNLNRAF